MKFSFVFISTEHVNRQIGFIKLISNYLEFELTNKVYGIAIDKIVIAIGCSGPLSDAWVDIPNGAVDQLKYTKTKKYLEFTLSLGYNEVIVATDDELINIVKRALSISKSSVESLKIKNFDITSFYDDLELLLNNKEWINFPEK